MHYLVTGHTGFKGAWLTVLLESLGHEVSGLALDPESGSLFEQSAIADLLTHDCRVDIRDSAAVAAATLRASRAEWEQAGVAATVWASWAMWEQMSVAATDCAVVASAGDCAVVASATMRVSRTEREQAAVQPEALVEQ